MFHIVMLDLSSLPKLFEMGVGPTLDDLQYRLDDSFANERVYYYLVPSDNDADRLDDISDETLERTANMLSTYLGKLESWRRMPWNRAEIVVKCDLPYWSVRGH